MKYTEAVIFLVVCCIFLTLQAPYFAKVINNSTHVANVYFRAMGCAHHKDYSHVCKKFTLFPGTSISYKTAPGSQLMEKDDSVKMRVLTPTDEIYKKTKFENVKYYEEGFYRAVVDHHIYTITDEILKTWKEQSGDFEYERDNTIWPDPRPHWTLINDSGHEISVYYRQDHWCKQQRHSQKVWSAHARSLLPHAPRKIKYRTLGSSDIKEGKLEHLCLDKLVASNEKVGFIQGGGTLYILYYYITGTKEQYPILYELRNPEMNRVYHFNPKDPFSKKNPLEVRNGKVLTVQEPAGGFWLETEEVLAERKKQAQEAYEQLPEQLKQRVKKIKKRGL